MCLTSLENNAGYTSRVKDELSNNNLITLAYVRQHESRALISEVEAFSMLCFPTERGWETGGLDAAEDSGGRGHEWYHPSGGRIYSDTLSLGH